MRHSTILVLILWSITGCSNNESPTNSNKASKVIRFSHVVKRQTPKGIGAQMFKRLVNNDTKLNQQIRVEVYPEAVLYNDEKVIDALLDNKVQLAAPSLSVLCKIKNDFCKFDQFHEFKDVTAVGSFQKSHEGQRLLQEEVIGKICNESKTNCLIGLFYWHNGMKQLSTTTACPEDKFFFMKQGLTFRIQDSDTIENEFNSVFKGAKTKRITFRNTMKSLEDSKVDGQENTWSNIFAEGYNKVQNCFIETNHGYIGYIVLTNQMFWNGLENSVRERLEKTLNEITSKVLKITDKYNKKSREQLEKEGKKIISLTEKELKN